MVPMKVQKAHATIDLLEKFEMNMIYCRLVNIFDHAWKYQKYVMYIVYLYISGAGDVFAKSEISLSSRV